MFKKLCVCTLCMNSHMCGSQRRTWVSFSIHLFLIPLRQDLSLSLELGSVPQHVPSSVANEEILSHLTQ